jgi:hypothetical protein
MLAFDGGAIDSEAAGNRGVWYAFFTDSTIFSPRAGGFAPIANRYGYCRGGSLAARPASGSAGFGSRGMAGRSGSFCRLPLAYMSRWSILATKNGHSCSRRAPGATVDSSVEAEGE